MIRCGWSASAPFRFLSPAAYGAGFLGPQYAPLIVGENVAAVAVARRGGIPVRMKSGHAYMKRAVIERGAVLGSEVSGHLFFGALSGIYNVDQPPNVYFTSGNHLYYFPRP